MPEIILQVTPFLHVPNIDEAVHFFVHRLGFTAEVHRSDYAYLQREVAGVRMLRFDPDHPAPEVRRWTVYLDVRDLEPLLAELLPRLTGLPPGDVYGPIDQSYGQREFMVAAPGGNIVVFGQALPAR